MVVRAQTGNVTFAEFLDLIHEDQKSDLLDGVIYMPSPESVEHNDMVLWLATILRQFLEQKRLGKATVNRVAYRLSGKSGPEPDVAVVLAERLGIIKKGYVDGAPDVAVEIVSPDSVDRDYDLKWSNYQKADVREYWIIDPDERRATFLTRGDAGFEEMPLDGHWFRSRALPGFSLDVRWLWQRPLPDTLPIVQSLLAGREAAS